MTAGPAGLARAEPDAAPSRAHPLFAEVIVGAPTGVLTYAVPGLLHNELCRGVAVRVPLGRRQVHGYVLALSGQAPTMAAAMREIAGIDEDRPWLTPALLDLVMFTSRYYRALPGDVLAVALPHAARAKRNAFRLTAQGQQEATKGGGPARVGGEFALSSPVAQKPKGTQGPSSRERALAWAAGQPRGFAARSLAQALRLPLPTCQRILRQWVSEGSCEAVARVAHRVKQSVWLRRAPDAAPRFTARDVRAAALWALLPADGSAVSLDDLRSRDPLAARGQPALLRRHLIVHERRDEPSSPWDPSASSMAMASATPLLPSAGQAAALSRIEASIAANAYAAFVLFGITGSGKTEVYLQAIDKVTKQGRSALILVPEIALTPQLGARFRDRFGEAVATFHSGLTPAQRRDEWERVATGQARIALGARSALFLPLDRLGIIVVDEEHESSFKQEEAPHYNARDLALWRGKQANACVVLGSATPSLETWHNATTGKSELLRMPKRAAGRTLPSVELIALGEVPRDGDHLLSPRLHAAIEATLAANEQVILFLNRRGFAPYVFCRDCGHSFRCLHCEVAMTLHRRRDELLCHYCGHVQRPPDTCPACQGHRVGASGPGIERLEEEVRLRYPTARCVRLDRDAARSRQQLTQTLDAFRRGDARILIGTQMVAKGHDFPGVTLVGAVSADASLNFPDFRAAERTFQLLTQVAGRAGRGDKPGHVLVQAYETTHYAIAAAAAQDFERFAEQELAFRQELAYPPFSHLALLRVEGDELAEVEAQAADEAHALQRAAQACGGQVLGPAPAPLSRLRGLYRVQVLIKAKERHVLRHTLAAALAHAPKRARTGVRRVLDIDPAHML